MFDFLKRKAGRLGFISNPSYLPPERDVRGFLSAYGSIFSLFGIVNRISGATSEVKWRLYKGSERGERNQIVKHPILDLLDFANEFQTGQEIIELHSICSDCAGKAFWYLPKNKLGVPGEIWILPPHQVKIIPSKTDFIAGYIYSSGREQVPLSKDEVIYFPMPDPLNPYGGIGYAQAAAVELDTESYSGKWNRNFFYNSARADAVLEFEGTLTDEQFERLKEQWEKRHGGVSGAHKIAILEGGAKYKQVQIMPKDMDFRMLRQQTRENLLFTFGMPLSVMGITENVNRANAEAGDYTFARWLIKPRLTRIKNKLNEQLLPMFKGTEDFELDFDEIVPETTDQKKGLAESGIRSGILTINEGRKLLNFDPIPAGDQLLVPLNMILTPKDQTKPPVEEGKTFKSIFPDEQRREAFWKIFTNKAAASEQVFIEKLRDMFADQESTILGKLAEDKLNRTHPLDIKEAKESFVKLATPILSELIDSSLLDAELLISPDLEHRAASPATLAALAWLKTRIGWAAEETSEQTAKLLANQLAIGFEAGEGIPELAKRVEGVFGNSSKKRALKIARTETIMAANEGALRGYDISGIKKAEFYAAIDERTDDDCEALHTQVFNISEAHGIIPVHPNCRCVWLPVV